jgi:uncharacterized membrane protein YeaQ/YmgE (transglycosylase-associated protein family)
MVLLNCLWVGVLAGMVGSRLIRGRRGFAPVTSSVAVALLGALIALVADGRFEHGATRLPHGDIITSGVGASLALCMWAMAQRLCWRDSRG